MLYLSLTLSQALNLGDGPAADGTLRLLLDLPTGRRLTVDFRQRSATVDDEEPPRALSWPELGHLVAPTHASAAFELAFDLGALGVTPGGEITIDFGGSDALAAPARFRLERPEQLAARRSAARQAGTTFRLASLNVLLDGLIDAQRGPRIGRLIKAARADIYCFQEAYQTPAATLAQGLQQLDPHGDGAPWQVHGNIDLLIASRGALHPLPVGATDGWHAAAVVELGPGRAVLLLNIHPPCCGYAGGSQDSQRIAVTRAMVDQIAKFRAGGYGAPLDRWRDAPVIVAGDWNLVGSRVPLDLMTSSPAPALQRWTLRHLVSGHGYTTRATPDKPSSYPPGVLDLVVHSSELQRRNGFILQAEVLEAAELAPLGLQPQDSYASDHLLLVADFELK